MNADGDQAHFVTLYVFPEKALPVPFKVNEFLYSYNSENNCLPLLKACQEVVEEAASSTASGFRQLKIMTTTTLLSKSESSKLV